MIRPQVGDRIETYVVPGLFVRGKVTRIGNTSELVYVQLDDGRLEAFDADDLRVLDPIEAIGEIPT